MFDSIDKSYPLEEYLFDALSGTIRVSFVENFMAAFSSQTGNARRTTMLSWRILLHAFLLSASGSSLLASEIPAFRKSAWFGEQVREQWFGEGIRVHVNASGDF